jgi:serine/threonine protein kinase
MKQSNQPTCPKCAAIIPDEAPGGLCPKCAMEGAATVSNPTSGGRHITPPGIAEIARHFPDLEILELLGAGGMGAVYKARQPQLDRFVALKILSHHLADDPAFVERFNREARVLGRLNHPNIVGIHDFGTAGPYCYLLMEYVDGVNLRQAMRAGRFTPNEALEMVQHLCAALKFAHEEGILHRDIKPENILIDSKGRVKIADFGIAKLVGEDRQQDFTLTLQGSVLGSPHYMAPEQIETPADVDQRADIYSLGVVLYEMLTGGLPIGRFALPSEKASMDARIDHIVMRTLEKEREARFQTAEDVRTSVGAVMRNPDGAKSHAHSFSPTQGTARFSLTAAILTGLSLVAIIGGAYIGSEYRGLGLTRDAGKILSLLMMILGAITAITGFLLGCVSLGSIRKSGGVLTGLGLSVFSVALWPLLLLGAFSTFFIKVTAAGDSYSGSVSIKMVALPVIGGALVISAFFLVNGLRRWARGVTDKEGNKRFPGLATPILTCLGIMVLGVVSIEAMRSLSSGTPQETPYASRLPEEEIPKMVEWKTSNPTTDGRMREWRLRKPEISVPFSLPAGDRVKLELELQQNFNAPETIWKVELPGPLERPAILELGTQLRFVNGPPGAIQELVLEFSGPKGSSLYSNRDFRDWKFDDSIASMIDLDSHGFQKYVIATCEDSGTSPQSGTLTLTVLHDSLEDE